METVYYSDDNKYAMFNGVKYSKQEKGYYRATLKQNTSNTNISRLHRAIWFYYNSEIPSGYDVHHKDENKENNNIENLMLIEHGTHSINHLDISLGKSWKNKIVKTYACSYCGELFETTHCYGEHQNAFCSKKCSFDHWYSLNKKERSKKICPHCNKEFIPVKTDQVYCRNNCGQIERTKVYRAKKKLLQTK